MGTNYSEKQKELYQRIDEVIHYIWDPIGINGAPEARDEYYSYLPEIFRIVEVTKSESNLCNFLKTIQTINMGLTENKENNKEVSEIILNWNEYLEEKYKGKNG